jgi:predicted AAA+ superfamily ATPase
VLLYGDAGTGKSSTVKAVVNHLFDKGLRLIEIRKDQLSRLPHVMAQIRNNPLRFIVFIDDLSFNQSDDSFSMLKAALEGSAAAKSPNAVIYATSNRRHIVRETFSERAGDELHRNDTVQETLSLSERFGLTILFARPDKKLYLEIVHNLCKRYGVNKPESELDIEAEAFALRRGYRSARCAEHFVAELRRKV